ncbi:MAG TPA: hypothetical protein VKY74_26105, partial [Chloroflexia bacterium]|nr:hypothetical protein [Chloroflexia bacterium]
MTMILRLLLFLAAVATLLVAMMGSGILSQSQMSGAERQLASQYQIAALVQRGRITRLQTETALTALLNGEASARTLILTQHAQLQRLADQYQTSALDNAAGADRYVQAVSRFNAATLLVLDANNTGGARAARTPLATLMGRAGDLADVEDALLMHGDAAITEAQAALDDTRALAGLERAVAAGLGLALIFVLAWITFLRTGRPLISLARQARHALQAPPQEMPEFIVEPPAPGEARELARALNSLVAQLQEKYLDLERANAELHELNHEARSASQAKTTFVA